MFRPRRAWLAAALLFVAAAAVGTGAQAETLKKRHKHFVTPAPVHVVDRRIPNEDYLNVGAVPDKGSDQRYFNDTKNPTYELGPTIFQRFQD